MTPDEYLRSILSREAVDTGISSPLWGVQRIMDPLIRNWANQFFVSIHPSGSFMKGTANKSGTDVDLFISLSEQTKESLKEIHDSLVNRLTRLGYTPRRQNVSVNITVSGYSVDLVPGKRQNAFTSDHSLYRRRADTWTKTNVQTHINTVINSGRRDEIRILKLWRNQKKLELPSFYLEMAVIAALPPTVYGSISQNVMTAFTHLRDSFAAARVIDPANTNNCLSDDLNATEKATIKAAASAVLSATKWDQIVI